MSEKTGVKVEKVSHANIYEALSAFQAEMEPLAKTATVEFEANNGTKVKYAYTPLSEIMEKIYPLLGKHGLSVMHRNIKDGTKDAVVAIVTHESYKEEKVTKNITKTYEGVTEVVEDSEWHVFGQITSGPIQIPTGGQMKDIGSAITYARRYSLTMALGLSSEEDKDAELIAESGKNAVQFAYNKARDGINNSPDLKSLEKAMKVLQSDLDTLGKGKAPALGLSKEQYEELLKLGEKRKVELEKSSEEK